MASARLRPDGFRERGDQVTRLEAFVDAAFAFAVTLLVISFDSLPDSVDALVVALLGAPAFAASFALIALFWWSHQTWSRRYGLDDGMGVFLSLVLVAIVLVYVYPLRMLFASFFAWITQGGLPAGFRIASLDDVRRMFLVYAAGWTPLCLVIVALHAHAWRRRDALALSLDERVNTRGEVARWLYAASLGIVSAVVAVALPTTVPEWLVGSPGHGVRAHVAHRRGDDGCRAPRARETRARDERRRPPGAGTAAPAAPASAARTEPRCLTSSSPVPTRASARRT